MKWYPQRPTCNGDLHDDLQDRGRVTCMMCARSYQASEVLAVQRLNRHEAPAAEIGEAA